MKRRRYTNQQFYRSVDLTPEQGVQELLVRFWLVWSSFCFNIAIDTQRQQPAECDWHKRDTMSLGRLGISVLPLQWRHNGRDSVSNHQPHDCLLRRRLFRHNENIKAPRHWPFFAVNSPVTGEFPAQMASNEENVSIWWRVIMPREKNWPATEKKWRLTVKLSSRVTSGVTRGLLYIVRDFYWSWYRFPPAQWSGPIR